MSRMAISGCDDVDYFLVEGRNDDRIGSGGQEMATVFEAVKGSRVNKDEIDAFFSYREGRPYLARGVLSQTHS